MIHMNYKDRARENRINRLAGLQQPITELQARETGHGRAEFVSNVYLVYHKEQYLHIGQ